MWNKLKRFFYVVFMPISAPLSGAQEILKSMEEETEEIKIVARMIRIWRTEASLEDQLRTGEKYEDPVEWQRLVDLVYHCYVKCLEQDPEKKKVLMEHLFNVVCKEEYMCHEKYSRLLFELEKNNIFVICINKNCKNYQVQCGILPKLCVRELHNSTTVAEWRDDAPIPFTAK